MSLIFVHGGVSGLEKDLSSLAYAVGDCSGSAIDCVERAVRALEDDPELNAGFGAVLNLDGEVELDAGIADGSTGRVAGIANVAVRHPISLARRVLENTPHVLLTGAGARRFGADLEPMARSSDEQHDRWEKANADGSLAPENYGAPEHVDTVGAIALDERGRLAAGSSTGGVFGKMPGRVGDAPIFGAGIYASAEAAVVGTGVGELFLETLACARAGRLIEDGASPQEACEATIGYLGGKDDTTAGILALDHEGRHGAAFRGGSWAVEGPDGPVAAKRLT